MRFVVLDAAVEGFEFDESQLGHQYVVKAPRAREISNARVDVIVAGEASGSHSGRLRRQRG